MNKPTYTAAYICDQLKLGLPWREHVRQLMSVVGKAEDEMFEEKIFKYLTEHPSATTTSEILTVLIFGIQMGMNIAQGVIDDEPK